MQPLVAKNLSQDIQSKGISDAYQHVINNFKFKKKSWDFVWETAFKISLGNLYLERNLNIVMFKLSNIKWHFYPFEDLFYPLKGIL